MIIEKQPRMKFYLIHSPSSGEGLKIYNAAFQLWKAQWKKIFKENKVDLVPGADEFLAQDVIAVLYDEEKEQIMIMNSLKFFKMNQTPIFESAYFMNYPSDAVEYFKRYETAMGILKLTINPDYKKQLTGVNISLLLVHLSTRFGHLSIADITIALCRLDLKVNQLSSASGFVNIAKPYDLYNTPVQAMYVLPGMITTPTEQSRQLQDLWDNRIEVNMDIFYSQKEQRLRKVA